MKARGEISPLIAPMPEGTSILASQNEDPTTREERGTRIYLVTRWVIVLCTVGPVATGLLVIGIKELRK